MFVDVQKLFKCTKLNMVLVQHITILVFSRDYAIRINLEIEKYLNFTLCLTEKF
jgi:hypothetical protein